VNAVNRNNAPEGACAKKASLADDKNSELEAAGWSGPSINEAAELQRFANAGRLVASVAHEMRNALAVAHANLVYLSGSLSSSESRALASAADEAREAIDRALASSRSVIELVHSKTAAPQRVAPAKLVKRALETVGSRLAGRVRVELELEPVPAVVADECRLHQVLVTLLLNAVEATPSAQGHLRVVIKQQGGAVRMAVSDNRTVLQTAGGAASGLDADGLGLCIARAIVRASGGELSASAGELGGAEFAISLPAAQ